MSHLWRRRTACGRAGIFEKSLRRQTVMRNRSTVVALRSTASCSMTKTPGPGRCSDRFRAAEPAGGRGYEERHSQYEADRVRVTSGQESPGSTRAFSSLVFKGSQRHDQPGDPGGRVRVVDLVVPSARPGRGSVFGSGNPITY